MSLGNLFKLIYNELIKIYILKSTWIMYIALAVIIVASGFLSSAFDDYRTSYSDDNWQEELQQENANLEQEMQEVGFFQEYNTLEIEKNNYYLENDIKPFGYGAWQFTNDQQFMMSIVSLLTIIVAGGIIANEFRWGTIKLLLIRPISRSKILLSKYIAVLLFALITLLFVVAVSWIVGAIFFGVEGLNPKIVQIDGDSLVFISVIGELAAGYGYKLVNLVMMGTFAFMISSIFRNSALAIGTAVFLMFAGNSIVLFFSQREWAKYILFANTDLSQYASDFGPMIPGMTLEFSIIVLIVYYIIFMVAAWTVFAKRDIAGS